MDDWTLIRNSNGESGWTLSSRLVMAIPDEVAQYAERRRITSYFALGETHDGAVAKQSWLWTTVEQSLTPYDFDSFRVFVWSLRHHRYETAHIERNLIGYSPVLLGAVPPPSRQAPKARGAKDSGEAGGKVSGFSITIQKKDGQRYQRSYAFIGNAVRFSGESPAPPAESLPEANATAVASAAPPEPPREQHSLYARFREQIGDWSKRLFGR